VAPIAIAFSGLAAVVSRATRPAGHATDGAFGVIDCEVRGLGTLPGPGDTLTTDLEVSPRAEGADETEFRLVARVARNGQAQPLGEIPGVRPSPAPSLPPATPAPP